MLMLPGDAVDCMLPGVAADQVEALAAGERGYSVWRIKPRLQDSDLWEVGVASTPWAFADLLGHYRLVDQSADALPCINKGLSQIETLRRGPAVQLELPFS